MNRQNTSMEKVNTNRKWKMELKTLDNEMQTACVTCHYYSDEQIRRCRYPVPEWLVNAMKEALPDKAETMDVVWGNEGRTCTAWERDPNKTFPFAAPHFHRDGTHGFRCCFGRAASVKKPVIPGYYWREFQNACTIVKITDTFMVIEIGSGIQYSMDVFPGAKWTFAIAKI